MLVEDAEKTWLFYEAVTEGKGHIEVAEVNDNCSVSAPVTVLSSSCHYSYPFVFRDCGIWYMIPESSADREVRLYKALAFPYQWQVQAVLLKEKAVDTTVFRWNETLILTTFFAESQSERVTPHAYVLADLTGNPYLREIPWRSFDTLKVRGAGYAFEDAGKLYRPAQVSQENRYGDAVMFYRIGELSGEYREEAAGELSASGLSGVGWAADGLHTYSISGKFEAIDIRLAAYDWKKLIRRAPNAVRRRKTKNGD